MSLAYPLQSGQTASRTWRRFQRALAITGGALLFACVIYALEKYCLQTRRRFIESPAEVMMRAFGVAHFLLGWLFLFSSPRLRSARAFLRLGGWTLVGALCCGLYGVLGGSKAPLVLLGFYALFMVHEVRDECGLARQSGDVPRDSAFGDALAQAVIGLLITLLAGVHLVRAALLDRASLNDLSLAWLAAGWGALLTITIVQCARARITAKRHHGSLRNALDLHAPLVQVYQTLVLVLFLGSLFGSVGLNLVILIHVSVWLVFVTEQLQKQDQGERRGLWQWLRHTPAGFFTAHIALVVILLALMAVRVHVWERAGWLSQMLSSSSFPYWSLLHICMAFAGKK